VRLGVSPNALQASRHGLERYALALSESPLWQVMPWLPNPVTARKDDAPAAVQAAIVNVAGLNSSSAGGGLIQTTSR